MDAVPSDLRLPLYLGCCVVTPLVLLLAAAPLLWPYGMSLASLMVHAGAYFNQPLTHIAEWIAVSRNAAHGTDQ